MVQGAGDDFGPVVQPSELLGIAVTMVVGMVVRMAVSVHVSVVVSRVVFHRLLMIPFMIMGVGVIVVFVVSLSLAGFEVILVFPEFVVVLHERANLGPISALMSRPFSVHSLSLSTGHRGRQTSWFQRGIGLTEKQLSEVGKTVYGMIDVVLGHSTVLGGHSETSESIQAMELVVHGDCVEGTTVLIGLLRG
jgi:hypothetical protein